MTINLSVHWCVRHIRAEVYTYFNIFDVLVFDLDSWLRTLNFLRLMVRPKSKHAEKTDSIVSADLEQNEL